MTSEKTPSFLKDIATLFKVRLGFFVVLSAILGWFMGVDTINLTSVMLLATGGYLLTGASNGLNQIIERDTDAIMSRTKNRPLPTGRMSVKTALFLSISAGIVGIGCLGALNYMAAILGVIALVLYAFFYTPLKSRTPLCVFVGAIPGALPPMIGYVAATGEFGIEPGTLFAVQFMWQFPHFWAIAWKASDDYAKAGFYLLSSKGGKDFTYAFLILLYSLFLLLVSILPVVFGFTGNIALFFIIVA